VGLEGLECRFPSNRDAGKHRLWFHKQNKFQERVNTEDEMLDQLTVLFLTQCSLGISLSGLDPCRLWRHWGAGWVSFTLTISGLVRARPNILPGKVPSESMRVAKTCERLGKRHSQQFLVKEGFVKRKRWVESNSLYIWGSKS
jgi:hypothetical protein